MSECIGVLRHMQQYFSYICEEVVIKTYGRARNAIGISWVSLYNVSGGFKVGEGPPAMPVTIFCCCC